MASSVDLNFQHALAALQAGKLDDAERLFKATLAMDSRHVAALNLLAILYTRVRRFGEAEQYARRALEQNPTSDATLYNYGVILQALNRPLEALERFTAAIEINPASPDSWNNRGVILNELKRHAEAIRDFDRVIEIKPDHAAAYVNKGKALAELKSHEAALAAYDRALSLRPDMVEALIGRGNILVETNRLAEAAPLFETAVMLRPQAAEAWHGRGDVNMQRGNYEEALDSYEKALKINPRFVRAHLGMAGVLLKLNRIDEALAAGERAIAVAPGNARAWLFRGALHVAIDRQEDALRAYAKAVDLDPDLFEAWLGIGNIYLDCRSFDAALSAYDKAIAAGARAAGWFGKGNVHFVTRRYEEARHAFDEAFAIDPGLPGLQGYRVYTYLHLCDWTNLDANIERLLADNREQKALIAPFLFLSLPGTEEDQLTCTRSFLESRRKPARAELKRYSHDRLRLAYISADYHALHPVAHLMVGLLEQHDRSRFDVTALSLGPVMETPFRDRLKRACDDFVDVGLLGDEDIAKIIREREIDIAIDLNGHTDGGRPQLFARRAAPIQVNFLGFPGTSGADYFDYIVADKTVIPPEQARFFTEKVAWLPDTYLPPDAHREMAAVIPTRAACGLPEDAFVFCCFNNTYKIMPRVFDVWMRVLAAVEGSVLWLANTNAESTANLRAEAEKRGVAGERLIFAPRLDLLADHLARHAHAGLFLDTLPYNAHATASNALWAGVPVITCLGDTFAGRVAASLLRALDMPELVTKSLDEYGALAIEIARDPDRLAALKSKLKRNSVTAPAFDMPRFARHLESAFETMRDRYLRGEEPTSFEVTPAKAEA